MKQILLVQACSKHGLQRALWFLRLKSPQVDIQVLADPVETASGAGAGIPDLVAVAVDESSGDYLNAQLLCLRLRGRRKAICLADEGAKLLPLSWRNVLKTILRRSTLLAGRLYRQAIRSIRRLGVNQTESLILRHITFSTQSEKNRPRILLVTEGDGASQRYRCEHKAEQLRLLGWPHRMRRAHCYQGSLTLLLKDAAWADAVILHRVSPTGQVELLLDQFERSRRPTIFDIDDWIFDPKAMDWIAWKNPESLEQIILSYARLLDRCSHAIGATSPLVAALKAKGKPAFLLANNISLEWLDLSEKAVQFRRPHDGILLGYSSGTPTHDQDFSQIVPALLHVMQAAPQVRLRIVGPLSLPKELAPLQDRIERIDLVPWRKLPYILSDLDVNLAPLEIGNPFAESKSELKYLEASPLAIPTIASPTPAFRAAITHGYNGLLANGPEEWIDALSSCLASSEERQLLGEQACRHVQEEYHPKAAAKRLAALLERILSGDE